MSLFEVFGFAFNAVMPIVLLILLGWFLRQKNFFSDDFLNSANKFVFNVSLPVLLFYNVYNIGSLGEIEWGTVLFSLVVILILFALGMFLSGVFTKDNRQKGVIWQSFYRSNFAIIGLPLAEALGGSEGVAIASVLSAFSIPVFNACAVFSLSFYTSSDGKSKINIKEVFVKILKNPLIRGVFCGFVLLGIRSLLPQNSLNIKNDLPFAYSAVEMVARTASPLALIVLGGKFRFSAIKQMKLQVSAGTFARIIFAPVLGVTAAFVCSKTGIIDFHAGHYAAFVALFGSPVAVSSAIMASQMDNDEQLANQILVWTSIFSVLTVFGFVVILKVLSFL